MARYEWSPTSRGKALGLCCDLDNSLQDITNIINIPKSTVRSIKTRGTIFSKPRSGRPKKLSSRDIHHLERYIHTNTFTHRVTPKRLKSIFSLKLSETTIRRALNALGYNHRVARRRPFLNKRDRKRRLQFAHDHKDWTVEDWA